MVSEGILIQSPLRASYTSVFRPLWPWCIEIPQKIWQVQLIRAPKHPPHRHCDNLFIENDESDHYSYFGTSGPWSVSYGSWQVKAGLVESLQSHQKRFDAVLEDNESCCDAT
ncbi:hypothetical protein TNCV_1409631 [Trichonephila clavipes]|uniref:Uncharacterized protein n=1 Tax=Trichonephila clavipes TaxID=2585209 RepID=A0A8X6R7M5_TRICX|nr:hypothetical protein TNCV_1409631 [Trichonephila clavipes]